MLFPGAVFNMLVLPLIFRYLCLIWHSRSLQYVHLGPSECRGPVSWSVKRWWTKWLAPKKGISCPLHGKSK